MRTDELRIFISSTFRDLQSEREYLVKRIFPEIRSICRERNVAFTEIDLRWGLTDEEATHGRIVRTCLEEIDRCRPYFIGIIGSRYGWCPEYHEIAMDPEIQSRYEWVENAVLEGRSILEMEFMHGVLLGGCDDAYFYQRKESDAGSDAPEQFQRLLEKVRESGRPLYPFESPEELGERVRHDLLQMIEHHWPERDVISTLELDRRPHTSFARSRRRAYIPIADYVQQFNQWLERPEGGLVVSGESGMGKSALVAWLVEFWKSKRNDPFVVEHYVGVSNGATDHGGLLRRVIEEIRERYHLDEEIPDSLRELEASFPEWLGKVGALPGYEGDELLLAIDAIDQLHTSSHYLEWLPERLPEHVRFLVSTRPGRGLERLRERGWMEVEMRGLHTREREAIIVRYLSEFHKALSSQLVRTIGHDEKGASPLFLRTLAEELRLHGDHESLDRIIDEYLQVSDLDELFQHVLRRMENDYGQEVVRPLLISLALSRVGLAENDILGITGASRADLSTLLHALDYHLLRSEGRLSFFHNYLRRAVESRYLLEIEDRRISHLRIADWFASTIDVDGDPGEIDRVPLSELLNALYQAGEYERLRNLLTTPSVLLRAYGGESEYDFLHYWKMIAEPSQIPELYAGRLNLENENDRSERDLRTLLQLVRLYRAVGEWKSAEEMARLAVKFSKSSDREEGNGSGTEANVRENGIGISLRGEALDELGEMLLLRGEHEEARKVFEERRSTGAALGDAYAVALAEGEIGAIELERGEYDEALRRFTEMHRICHLHQNRSGMAKAGAKIGQIFLSRSEYDEATDRYREALGHYQSLGDRRQTAFCLGQIGLIAWNRKEFEEGMQFYQEEKEIYRRLGDRHGEAMALGKIGLVHLDRNDLDEAEACFEEYRDITTSLGYARGIGFALGDLGIVHLRRSAYDEAMEHFDAALQTHRSLDFPFGVALWLKWKAETVLTRLEAGNDVDHIEVDRAIAWAEECQQLSRAISKLDTAEEAAQLVERMKALAP